MAAKTMTDTLVDHQRQNASSCLCGWAELGKSHPEHQAAALAAAGFGEIWKHQAAAHGFNMARMDAEAKLADAMAQALEDAATDLEESAQVIQVRSHDAGTDNEASVHAMTTDAGWLRARAATIRGEG